MRSRGLEPPRLAALAPQASASASSATTAMISIVKATEKTVKRVGGKLAKPSGRLEKAVPTVATVFSGARGLVAKLPEVAKQVLSRVAAPRAASQAPLQELLMDLPTAARQAACSAERWRALSQV